MRKKVFAGPVSESVPSSITGFAHTRSRANSLVSFTYFQDSEESSEHQNDEAIENESDEEFECNELDQLGQTGEDDAEIESIPPHRRKSSGFSRNSTQEPLISRHDSSHTDFSGFENDGRMTQKILVVTEDLTIVIAGFRTRSLGMALYLFVCTITLGLGYLVFRWLPRWKISLLGSAEALRECSWVVIEVRA